MGGGCRRQRLIKASLRRLEELNAEIRERKERLNVFDGRLDNFRRQKEAYEKWREKTQRKMSKQRKERKTFLLTQIDTKNICKIKRKEKREIEHEEYLNRMKQITAERKKMEEELYLKEKAEKEELMKREKENKQQQQQQQQRRRRHIVFPSIFRKPVKTVLTSGEGEHKNKKQKTKQLKLKLKLPILRENAVDLSEEVEEDDAKTGNSKKKEKMPKIKSNHQSTFSEEKQTWEEELGKNGKNKDFQTEKKQPQYLEVDLGKMSTIQQIILQRKQVKEGRNKTHNKQTFTITYSLDGVEWLTYDDKYGEELIFEAAPFQISTHSLDEDLVTRFIRIYPTKCCAGDEFLGSILQVEFKDVSNTEVSEGKEQKRKKHQKKHVQTKLKPVAHITTPPQTDTLPPIDPPLESVPANEIVLDETSAIYDKLFQDDLKIHLDEELLKYQNHVTSTSRKIMAFKGESVIEEEEKEEDDEAKERKFRKMVFLANKRRKLKLQLELNRKKNQMEISKSKKEEIISKHEKTFNQEDFFSMYCIITDEQQEWYTAIYRDLQEQQDETAREDLTMEDVSDGLLIVHKSLVSDSELQYIKTVLDILGVNLNGKISLRVFSLVAAFAEKIISTRELFRYVIANVDYKALSTCFSKAKQLYTILLREKETVIHVEDLMFELHAAEMNQKILKYILQNQDKTKIDFLDYITYFPLFIHTHDVIVQNPI